VNRGTLREAHEHLATAAAIAGIDVADSSPPTARHVIAGGIRIHVLDWGNAAAAPILFLHGGALTAHTWDLTSLAMRRMFHCVAMDLRGHGDSEWSPAMEYDVEDHLADVRAVVGAMDLAPCVVVGHSLGAMVALALAAAHPDLVRALVLVDATPDVTRGAVSGIREFVSSTSEPTSLDRLVEAAVEFNPRRTKELLRRSLLHNLRPARNGQWTWKYDRRHLDDSQFERLRREFARVGDRAGDVVCPVMVVRGAESEAVTPAGAARFAGRFPQGCWTSVDNAGHTVQGDNPAGLVRELRAFLDGLA
jgi:esterase